MIYFIEAVDSMGPDRPLEIGHIKIGFTDMSMECRLARLQTGSSYRLRVLGTTPGTKRVEQRLHRQFRHHKIHGEWFKPAPELLEHIKKETPQFLAINLMDWYVRPEKFTKHSIKHVEKSGELFNWEAIRCELARRLRAGETPEEIAATCTLGINVGCMECGWIKGSSKKRHRSLAHFLFVKNEKLLRYSFHFQPDFPPDFVRSVKNDPPGYRSACYLVWQKAMNEWFSEKRRLHL